MTTITEMLDRLRVHDVDSHISEPCDLWTTRMSSKWGDAIPHIATRSRDRRRAVVHRRPPRPAARRRARWCRTTTRPPPAHPTRERRLAWMDEHGVFSQVAVPEHPRLLPAGLHAGRRRRSAPTCVRGLQRLPDRVRVGGSGPAHPRRAPPWWDVDGGGGRARALRRHWAHAPSNLAWEFEQVGLPALSR